MIQSIRWRSFFLHIFLLAVDLRGSRLGFVPLFGFAPPEMIPEVDDILGGDFQQFIENSREEELVENLDQVIGNSLEEDVSEDPDNEARDNKAIANDFFNSKHLQSQPGQHLIKALPILDQLRNVSVDDSGNQTPHSLVRSHWSRSDEAVL